MRQVGRVVNMAAVVAIGVRKTGEREVRRIGLDEDGAHRRGDRERLK